MSYSDPNTLRYVLGPDGEPRREPDLFAWGHWLNDNSIPNAEGRHGRTVALTTRGEATERVTVSTVFLALDLSCGDPGGPVLWETLVGGGPYDGCEERYTSRAAAVAGHARWVARVEAALAGEEPPLCDHD